MAKTGKGTGKRRRQRFKDPSDPLVAFDKLRLRAAMQAWRIPSVKELARLAGLPQSSVSDLLRKGRKSHLSTLRKVAEALRVPVEWIKGQTDQLPLQPFTRDSPYRSIAEALFVVKCNRAYERDLRRRRSARDREVRRQLQGEFIFAIYALLDHRRWLKGFFEPDWDLIPPDATEFPMSKEVEARLTEAVIDALDAILTPWFEGHFRLDYQRVIEKARRL